MSARIGEESGTNVHPSQTRLSAERPLKRELFHKFCKFRMYHSITLYLSSSFPLDDNENMT